MGDEAKAQRRQLTTQLGFEESEEMPGVATLPAATDKDMLLLIDVSGSMSGRRIHGATDNAKRIYKNYTDEKDHVGLLHFHHLFYIKMALEPRAPGGAKWDGPRAQLAKIEKTRNPDYGGTAFYDALIKAVA